MKIQFLGQAGFIVDDGNNRILIDPYLSNYVVEGGIGDARWFSRAFPAPLNPDEVYNIDLVFITHDHADHCDPLTLKPILERNPECSLIGSYPVIENVKSWGVSTNRLVLAEPENENTIRGVSFWAVPSAHYGLDQDKESGCYPYFGYVIKLGEKFLYHSGDTILYDGMIERLNSITYAYDVACLPVNGRSRDREELGIIGNLHPQEAADLAARIQAKSLIPMHNDLFTINRSDPGILNDYVKSTHPSLKIQWMQARKTIEL